MSKFRYIAIGPGRVDGKHVQRMGMAIWLHDFLIDHQTDARGSVNYGKPISYEWIIERFPNAPALRRLQSWMSILKEEGYVEVVRLKWGRGMLVRILNQKKWPSNQAVQMPLFPPPPPLEMPVQNPVEKQWKPTPSIPRKIAVIDREKSRFKRL